MEGNDERDINVRGVLGTNLDRRRILGAAGGFALAASGLFLPATGEEAKAREGANGGEMGGRRGKDQRGRNRHRRQKAEDGRKDRDKEKAPGRLPWQERGIAFHLSNNMGPIGVEFWRLFPGTAWEKVDAKTFSSGHPADFQDARPICAVWLDSYYYIKVVNPLAAPWVEVQFGERGEMHAHDGWTGGIEFERGEYLLENDRWNVYPGGPWQFDITRKADSNDYKEVSIYVNR